MQQMQSIQKIERDLSNRLKSTKEKPKKHEQAKIKAGSHLETRDLFKMVGYLVKDQLLRVRVPALTFTSFTFGSIRAYWNAFWGGHTLPLRLKIDDQVDKEIFVGRLSFAVTFIIADSIYLVGKGIWSLKKLFGRKVNILNGVVVGGLVVGFLGWVYPWFLEQIGVDMKILDLIRELGDEVRIPDIDLTWLVWVPIVGFIGAVPFSVKRFRKWRGLKFIGGREVEDHQDR